MTLALAIIRVLASCALIAGCVAVVLAVFGMPPAIEMMPEPERHIAPSAAGPVMYGGGR